MHAAIACVHRTGTPALLCTKTITIFPVGNILTKEDIIMHHGGLTLDQYKSLSTRTKTLIPHTLANAHTGRRKAGGINQ